MSESTNEPVIEVPQGVEVNIVLEENKESSSQRLDQNGALEIAFRESKAKVGVEANRPETTTKVFGPNDPGLEVGDFSKLEEGVIGSSMLQENESMSSTTALPIAPKAPEPVESIDVLTETKDDLCANDVGSSGPVVDITPLLATIAAQLARPLPSSSPLGVLALESVPKDEEPVVQVKNEYPAQVSSLDRLVSVGLQYLTVSRMVVVSVFLGLLLLASLIDTRATRQLPFAKTTSLAAGQTQPVGGWVMGAIPWPKKGEAAVAVPATGFSASSSSHEALVPIASMTKVMTAYVVLQDHPLSIGQSGPIITITQTDANAYGTDIDTDQSSIKLVKGEKLSESQLVEGMLVHSANDFAYSLAMWDARSIPAFVAKMNGDAKSLGMTRTHYVDVSGYTPGSVSTASNVLDVAAAAMAIPIFATDVSHPSVTLPVSGTSFTYTPLLTGFTGGVRGVVGIKSGFTTQAGGCDLMAYRATVGFQSVMVLAVVTSQEGGTALLGAGTDDLHIAQSVASDMHAVPVVASGVHLGKTTANGKSVAASTNSSAVLIMMPGDFATVRFSPAAVREGQPKGTVVGELHYSLGNQGANVGLVATQKLPSSSLIERIL